MPIVSQDSNFASAILQVAKDDTDAKKCMAQAAQGLKDAVVTPILEKLKEGKELENHEKDALKFLIEEHSSDTLQWDGAMPDHSNQEISDNGALQIELLTKLSERMTPENIMQVDSISQLAGVMKAITSCSFTYVEYWPPQLRGPNFDNHGFSLR